MENMENGNMYDALYKRNLFPNTLDKVRTVSQLTHTQMQTLPNANAQGGRGEGVLFQLL